eukprot:ANDGO_06555.mRNA.1 hypothetical protein
METEEEIVLAVLYQAAPPPAIDGIVKPMKIGGYRDSSADIAFALHSRHSRHRCKVLVPAPHPDPAIDDHWAFPDTEESIRHVVDCGANVLWLNTILFNGHPIEKFQRHHRSCIRAVGQPVHLTHKYDDKKVTNDLLISCGVRASPSFLATSRSSLWPHEALQRDELDERHANTTLVDVDSWNAESHIMQDCGFTFPVVVKPVRGRGSAGVVRCDTPEVFVETVQRMIKDRSFGNALMVEPFLEGDEVTVTVMPPGQYIIDGQQTAMEQYWCLPAVLRFSQVNGVMPSNREVPVIRNSKAVPKSLAHEDPIYKSLYEECVRAAQIVAPKAPLRIDARQSTRAPESPFFLFDLNMKPNLTGRGRPGREEQDCLVAMAAAEIGWSFTDYCWNMLLNSWNLESGIM